MITWLTLLFFFLGDAGVVVLASSSSPLVASTKVTRDNVCSSNVLLDSFNETKEEIQAILNVSIYPQCGVGRWREVVNFNLNDSLQNCPQPWTRANVSSGHLCATASCQDSATFHVSGSYSQVCGKIIGYAEGLPDAFFQHNVSNVNIDMNYLDGVSLTYGSPRHHIWSFAAGHSMHISGIPNRCPCESNSTTQSPSPQSYVGENYFCDGRHNGLLWDGLLESGQPCTSTCCAFHSPPWFNTILPASTSENIEARICSDEPFDDERIYVQEMIILVQ